MEAVVIADDLTGASEMAACFAAAGYRPRLRFPLSLLRDRATSPDDIRMRPSDHVLVMDTESRQADGHLARRRLCEALADLPENAPPLIYKKIDSTLRGPIGEELVALTERMETPRVLVAPAFPAQGRTTRHGVQYVHGVPVGSTEAANDPAHPVTCSHVPSFLEHATGRPAASIGLASVEQGAAHLGAQLEAEFVHAQLVVVDAVNEAHLEVLSSSILSLSRMPLVVGSAGLARPLARRLSQASAATRPSPAALPPAMPVEASSGVLIVCGSRHGVSLEQAEVLRSSLDVAVFVVGREVLDGGSTLAETIAGELRRRHVLVMSPRDTITDSSGGAAASLLGTAVARISALVAPAGLVLTGGETAFAALRSIGIRELEIDGEVVEGIPTGVLTHPKLGRLPVVTKAGGFGGGDALVQAVNSIKVKTGPTVPEGGMCFPSTDETTTRKGRDR